MRTVIRLMPMH